MVPTQLSITEGRRQVSGLHLAPGRRGWSSREMEWAGFRGEAVFVLTFSGRHDQRALLFYSLCFTNTGRVSGTSASLLVQGRGRKEALAVLWPHRDSDWFPCLCLQF